MITNKTEYKEVEYENHYGWDFGSIVYLEDEVCHVKIGETVIDSIKDIDDIIEMLNIAKKEMWRKYEDDEN